MNIGTDANPTLTKGPEYNVGIVPDGLAANGLGQIIWVNFDAGTLNSLDLASKTSTVLASGIPTADDPAPITGAGSPNPTPELGSSVLLGTGLVPLCIAAGWRRRRAKRKNRADR